MSIPVDISSVSTAELLAAVCMETSKNKEKIAPLSDELRRRRLQNKQRYLSELNSWLEVMKQYD